MKRILSLSLILILSLALFSCESESKKTDRLNLLFSVSGVEGAKNNMFFIPIQNGFLYFSETEGGTNCGFADIDSGNVTESLFTTSNKYSAKEITGFSVNAESACINTPEGVFLAILKKSAAKKYTDETKPIASPVFYTDCAFVHIKDGLLLLTPYDLSEEYVLSSDPVFGDGASLITANGKNIYFSLKDGETSSLYRLVYGESRAEKLPASDFSLFFADNGNAVFTSGESGAKKLSVLNGATGTVSEFSVPDGYVSFSVSADAERVACLKKTENGDFIDVLNGASGTRIARLSVGERKINPDIAIAANGKSIIYSILPSPLEKGEIVAYFDISGI